VIDASGFGKEQDRAAAAGRIAVRAGDRARAAAAPPHPSTRWGELNAAVVKAYQEGEYNKGIDLAEQALALALQAFGPRHPNTLTSMNNLAGLYQSQGRYGEAEPLLAEALQLAREVAGPNHPNNADRHEQPCGAVSEPGPVWRCRTAVRRGAAAQPRANAFEFLRPPTIPSEAEAAPSWPGKTRALLQPPASAQTGNHHLRFIQIFRSNVNCFTHRVERSN